MLKWYEGQDFFQSYNICPNDFAEYEKQTKLTEKTKSKKTSLTQSNAWIEVNHENTVRKSRRGYITRKKCNRQSRLFYAVNY